MSQVDSKVSGLPDNVEKDLSVSPGYANLAALPFILPCLLQPWAFGLVHGYDLMWRGLDDFFHPRLFVPVLVIGVLLHELIHGLT